MPTRDDLRNIAIIAHVDHGKTTLVDAMLRQSGAFSEREEVADRVMDSMDLEREKGITILAKQTAITYGTTIINIVDTPGHADFGGEVERALAMVDGALLLVDAAEGPLPQTRFVLRKALARHLPMIVVLNKVDRPDARVKEVLDEVYELFMDLDATEEQIEFPVIYASGKHGWASTENHPGANLIPLFDAIIERVAPPNYESETDLQALVTNIDASPYLGRLAICRIVNGTLTKGANVAWCRRDGSVQRAKITEMFVTDALTRVPAEKAGPGEIVAIAGIADITIGETLANPEDPKPLPLLTVDEPSISMTFGVNTAPLAGREGSKVTARLIKNRLDQELIGNVSLRVLNTDRPDTWEVQGRGELALAILIEMMRREGYELTVGKPRVITREIDGKTCEPVEVLEIDCPADYLGAITQVVAARKATLVEMVNHGTGWIRIVYSVPSRGLIGIRTEILTQTKGTAQIHHAFDRYEPWFGEIRSRQSGSMVADRSGVGTSYALLNLQERGRMFIAPGDEVYEGMIVGENARAEDMDVNPTKEKKLTNMRSSTAEELVRLTPPALLSLEGALEFIAEDECIEVTPKAVRLRKWYLSASERARLRSNRVAGAR
ncbi:MAG: translational GTPase TypA [Actinomycetota bacterium]|nr:translational GTPase TypA [Actinomycetota bacterium]MDA8209215.1 translational GTPase TypA [Actinomycetota bacterium]